jgi:hypothetical protein
MSYPYFMRPEQFKIVWENMNLDERTMLFFYDLLGWKNERREHLLNMRKKYLGW